MTRVLACGALVLAAALVTPTAAHHYEFVAELSGVAMIPPNPSPGHGDVHVTLDLDLVTLHVEAHFDGLFGGVTAAQIAGLTPAPLSGVAGAALGDPSLPGFPLGVPAGMYEATIDLTAASSYSPEFIAASGGTVSDALNALIDGLIARRTYFVIATSTFIDGEVRGFLEPIRGPLTGDMNCDFAINNFDIDLFVLALADPAAYGAAQPGCHVLNADANHDHVVNNFDIDAFVECLTVGCE